MFSDKKPNFVQLFPLYSPNESATDIFEKIKKESTNNENFNFFNNTLSRLQKEIVIKILDEINLKKTALFQTCHACLTQDERENIKQNILVEILHQLAINKKHKILLMTTGYYMDRLDYPSLYPLVNKSSFNTHKDTYWKQDPDKDNFKAWARFENTLSYNILNNLKMFSKELDADLKQNSGDSYQMNQIEALQRTIDSFDVNCSFQKRYPSGFSKLIKTLSENIRLFYTEQSDCLGFLKYYTQADTIFDYVIAYNIWPEKDTIISNARHVIVIYDGHYPDPDQYQCLKPEEFEVSFELHGSVILSVECKTAEDKMNYVRY